MAYVSVSNEVERSADPSGAALVLDRISAAHPDSAERLWSDSGLRSALIAVSAASPWLARVCVTDRLALDVLGHLDRPFDISRAWGPDGSDLQRVRQLGLLRVAGRDLLGLDGLEEVGHNLSTLATALLEQAYQLTLDTAPGVAVIGMGKLGGGELNYSSDIDILLVSPEPTGRSTDVRPLLKLARSAWRVDLDLRPEGRSGPLSRTLPSYEAYWDRWAHTWEFQALLKARFAAGDEGLGRRFDERAAERVWGRPFGADELRDVRRLKARAEVAVSRRGLRERELKRGRGGIRDIEFAIQLLQLVHGRADPSLRSPSTLEAAQALAAGGYIGSDDASALEHAYRFLRTVEHRLQLYENEQVHTVPSGVEQRAHLARVLGYRDQGAATAVGQFDTDLRRHQATVRAIHERLFFRPLLEAFTAAADRAESLTALPADAVAARLTAFGFADADRTRQAVIELTRGFSRTSRLMHETLPVLLDWLSSTPNPDLGLLGLRTLATGRHSRDILGAVCRESPEAARQLCLLLGTGPRFARDLQRHPDVLNSLTDRAFFLPRSRDDLDVMVERSLAWRSGEGAVELGLRLFGRQVGLRIAARDVLGVDDVDATGSALTELAEAVIAAALRHVAPPLPFAVIGMGRLGGRELAYQSDLDLLFVYDNPEGLPPGEAAALAEASTAALVQIIGGATPATGLYRVDTTLRPEGRLGPPARSLDAYATYYRRWARAWERQALIRGRWVGGDANLGERFAAVANQFVWDRPLSRPDVVEIRRTKARMERERVPASEDPKFHLKLGPGSLSDIEWTAQLLQLEWGVRETGTVAAIMALRSVGALDAADASTLIDAYLFCERARNRLQLVRDAQSDALPTTGPVLAALSRSLETTPTELRNDYRRYTRRARQVMERLFYGGAPG